MPSENVLQYIRQYLEPTLLASGFHLDSHHYEPKLMGNGGAIYVSDSFNIIFINDRYAITCEIGSSQPNARLFHVEAIVSFLDAAPIYLDRSSPVEQQIKWMSHQIIENREQIFSEDLLIRRADELAAFYVTWARAKQPWLRNQD